MMFSSSLLIQITYFCSISWSLWPEVINYINFCSLFPYFLFTLGIIANHFLFFKVQA